MNEEPLTPFDKLRAFGRGREGAGDDVMVFSGAERAAKHDARIPLPLPPGEGWGEGLFGDRTTLRREMGIPCWIFNSSCPEPVASPAHQFLLIVTAHGSISSCPGLKGMECLGNVHSMYGEHAI